ncbi:hypothetical protein Droror1_Dr00025973 [Drosera rotundifolia]
MDVVVTIGNWLLWMGDGWWLVGFVIIRSLSLFFNSGCAEFNVCDGSSSSCGCALLSGLEDNKSWPAALIVFIGCAEIQRLRVRFFDLQKMELLC